MGRSMSVTQGQLEIGVLHIRPELPLRDPGGAAIRAVEGMLAAASLRPQILPDVYRGLARLCSADSSTSKWPRQWRAVIVCVDNLAPAELEFFSVLRRKHPNVPVYVYGMEHFESRIQQAIGRGATGRVNEAVIRQLADAARVRATETGEQSGEASEVAAASLPCEPRILSDEPETAEAAIRIADELEVDTPEELEVEDLGARAPEEEEDSVETESHEEEDAELNADDDEVRGPARVPWLGYSNGPARGSPGRTPPPSAEASPPPPAKGVEEEARETCEPLLTEDELQALLGGELDDIAAIAPQERREPEVDGHMDGKGGA